MIIHEIAYRYAQALFNQTHSIEEMEKRLNDLEEIVKFFHDYPKLKNFFSSPQISKQDKERILRDNLKSHFEDSFISFLAFLIHKGRFEYLSEIAREYAQLFIEKLGIIEVDLITAVPIEEKIKEQLKAKLEAAYHRKIRIIEKIDSRVIGGATLLMASHMVDASLKGKLAKLKNELLAVKV